MRIAGIIRDSIVDGYGVRDVVFLQGCPHHCPQCHNQSTWDASGGEEISTTKLSLELLDSNNDITISGGEPLLQYEELLKFMKAVRINSNKRFWLYTGFRFEEIPPYMWKELSEYVDVVVDGRFDIEKKTTELPFVGSSNQRLIDLKRTIATHKIQIYDTYF